MGTGSRKTEAIGLEIIQELAQIVAPFDLADVLLMHQFEGLCKNPLLACLS